MDIRYELKDGWTLGFTHPANGRIEGITATVPGNVEIDLQREGLVADPYPPDRHDAMQSFELVNDWVYQTKFDAPKIKAGQTISLVFEGIDTIADVTLNGEVVLHCENMFIPHTLDVTAKLKETGNTLAVRIFSPELHARQFKHPPIQVSRDHRQGQAYLRKARHMWGWDNAPRLLSAGLWRPVTLVVQDAIRFTDVYIYTQKVQKDSAAVGFNWTIETPDIDLSSYRGKMTLSLNGKVALERPFDVEFIAGRVLFSVPSPQLWWPRGYGAPTLYDLTLTLSRNGEQVAEWNSHFGIREVTLVRTETTNRNGDGEFVFKCNGEKIYINGTNWKSLDALLSLAAGKMQKALDLCVDLNCNMVRIWGGGVYEDHDFFDDCDKNGLLVWQDFMFACEFPPRDEFFLKQVKHEAETIVKRLRNHPSLALWCGDNEVDMTVFWGLFIPPNVLPSHNLVNRQILKNAVIELDPYRSYVESSPYISDEIASGRWDEEYVEGEDRMMRMAPEQHVYATGTLDFYTMLRKSSAHFMSETGPFFINAMSQSPDIVQREMARTKRLWDYDTAKGVDYKEYHQRDGYFLLWKERVQRHLGILFQHEFTPDAWEDLALGVNIEVGNIFKFAIEYFRIRKWRKTGVIWWSLLDMWPMMFNYSVVDFNFKKKEPVYSWIRQSQQASCLAAEESKDGEMIGIFALNDTLEQKQGRYRVLTLSDKEDTSEGAWSDFVMEKNTTSLIAELPNPKKQALWIMEWTINGQSFYNHYVCGKPPYSFETYRRWCHHLDRLYAKR